MSYLVEDEVYHVVVLGNHHAEAGGAAAVGKKLLQRGGPVGLVHLEHAAVVEDLFDGGVPLNPALRNTYYIYISRQAFPPYFVPLGTRRKPLARQNS